MDSSSVCPKCQSPLGPVIETPTGKKLQRCSAGNYDSKTRTNSGCSFVKWLPIPAETLDEVCPECGAPLIMQTTKFGKKLKKCSKGGWDPQTKTTTGCPYVSWINGSTEALDEPCPKCGQPLVLFTTAGGKKLKKCSTSGWDKVARKAAGCPHVQWLTAKSSSD